MRKLKSPFCGFCVRCQQKVYPAERVGLELNIMLHTNCFKCAQCGLTLTMSTFLLTTDPVTGKKTVLCKTHAPKANGNSLDPSSFAIRNAVQAQRINSGGYSVVTQDAMPWVTIVGNRAKAYGLNIVGLKRRGYSKETIQALQNCYATLFRKKLQLKEALEQVEQEHGSIDEVRYFIDFVRSSERGVVR